MKKKKYLLLFIALLLGINIAGCGEKDGKKQPEKATEKKEEIATLEWAFPGTFKRVADAGFSEGLCFVVKDNVWSCINEEGDTVFDLDFHSDEEPSPFYHGYSITGDYTRGAGIQVINTKGEYLLPTGDDEYYTERYNAGKVAIDDNDTVYVRENGNLWVIQEDESHLASDAELQEFKEKEEGRQLKYWCGNSETENDQQWEEYESDLNRFLYEKLEEKYGEGDDWCFSFSWNNLVRDDMVPNIYQGTFYADIDAKPVLVVHRLDEYGEDAFFMDTEGNVLGKEDTFYFNTNDKFFINRMFCEGLMPIRMGGEWLTAKVEDSGTTGLTGHTTGKDLRYGYVNDKAEVVIEPEYTYVTDFQEGCASVQQDGKFYCIDTNGKKLGIYPEGARYPGIFINGYSCVYTEDGQRFVKIPEEKESEIQEKEQKTRPLFSEAELSEAVMEKRSQEKQEEEEREKAAAGPVANTKNWISVDGVYKYTLETSGLGMVEYEVRLSEYDEEYKYGHFTIAGVSQEGGNVVVSDGGDYFIEGEDADDTGEYGSVIFSSVRIGNTTKGFQWVYIEPGVYQIEGVMVQAP